MAERRNIGEILMSTGRVGQDDIARAVTYQRENGGYFGEALVALGRVTPEELEWSLASQFDLPYVFPDADSIDPEAAALVTPEWALAHLAMPIMKTEDELTVVLDSPLNSRAVEELQARTDKEIRLALASPAKIRELVRQVYGRLAARESGDRPAPLTVEEGFALALEAAAPRYGISTRGPRAWFWYDDGGTVHRHPLQGGWHEGLDQLVSPRPSEHLSGEGPEVLEAEVTRGGMVNGLELRYLARGGGQEYLMRPLREHSSLQERFPPPPPGVVSEIRLLARSGSARFLVRCQPDALGREIAPHLPALLFDPSCRSVHLHPEGRPADEEVFAVAVPNDAEAWKRRTEELRAFRFDVVSVDASGAALPWALGALEVAPAAFILWSGEEDLSSAHEAGIRWELRVEREQGSRLAWGLIPLQG